jgi:hypothetical protein
MKGERDFSPFELNAFIALKVGYSAICESSPVEEVIFPNLHMSFGARRSYHNGADYTADEAG